MPETMTGTYDKKSALPPRLMYNYKLSSEYLAANGPFYRYPKVTDQIETIPIRGKINPYGYNASIVEFMGQILLAYRYHEVEFSTKLAVAQLDQDFTVTNNRNLPLFGISAEDPRWFIYRGELYISWVESNWPKEKWSVIKFQKFDHGSITMQPNLGDNNGKAMEKNWVFFELDERLFCIYRCDPSHRIVELNEESVCQTFETQSPKWDYGTIRGGTPPVDYDGRCLRFFHSALDNDLGECRRRYFFGAYLMEPQPPFNVLAVSRKPIIYGSELDNRTPAEVEDCKKLKVNMHMNTCLPYGVMSRDGYWIVSLGVNDTSIVLAKIRPEDLHL